MADKQYEDMINGVVAQVDRVAEQVIKIKTKYEPKSYDYSSVASTLSIVAADGGQQASITPPAGVDTVPIGSYTKIIITPPGTPQETPGDDDQVTLNGSFLWINKVNTDIMQWKEIKNNVANGDIMVIERIADSGGFKNYQLVKWEVKQQITKKVNMKVFMGTKLDTINIPYDNIISVTGQFVRVPHITNVSFFKNKSNDKWLGFLQSTDPNESEADRISSVLEKSNNKPVFTDQEPDNFSISYWEEEQ